MSASQVHSTGLPGENGARLIQFPAAIAKVRSLGLRTRIADRVFRWLMLLCAVSVPAIVALIAVELVSESRMSLHTSGWQFFDRQIWDPVSGEFGALSFIYGTLVSSFLALAIAVPLSIGLALFNTEMCPRVLRTPLSFLTDLLAAIPSVIYGLWAIFVLVPLNRTYVEPFLAKRFGWTGLFEGPPYGIGMLAAGMVLAVMIIPIISSITREVFTAVPRHQREAAYALGATALAVRLVRPWR
jgi:phosphate transport system permease protein